MTRVTVSSPKHHEAAKQHPQALQVPWVVLSREQESLDVSVFTLYPKGQLGRPQLHLGGGAESQSIWTLDDGPGASHGE